jgi:putative membrane protein
MDWRASARWICATACSGAMAMTPSDPDAPKAVPDAAASASPDVTPSASGNVPVASPEVSLPASPTLPIASPEVTSPATGAAGDERSVPPVTASVAAPKDPQEELRLHPFSWLFVMVTQMRSYVLPLGALIVFGRGQGWELWGLLGAVFVGLYALIYSVGFRYRLEADEMIVREGIIFRTERHVPYARIQNVVQERNPLHRFFGVTALHLESAAGGKPEAVMNVITLAAAARIEALLQRRGAAGAAVPNDSADVAPLLALDSRELLRLGLMSNRGAVIVGALFALFYQFDPFDSGGWKPGRIGKVEPFFRDWNSAFAQFHEMFPGPLAYAAAAALAVISFFVVLKLLSIVMAVITFHGFALRSDGERVSTVSGLFTRRSASARVDKIQRYSVSESWLARRLGRRTLACEVATGAAEAGEQKRERLRWLAPVATPSVVESLLRELSIDLDLARVQWRPLHPRAWWRAFKLAAVFWSLAVLPAVVWFGPYTALLWFPAMAYAAVEARASLRFSAYSFDGDVFAWRSGWLKRRWAFARIAKGQSVALLQSPFDRRAKMAAVRLDTAGQARDSYAMRVPYLPEGEARALFAALSRAIATVSAREDADTGATLAAPVPSPA